MIDHQHTRSLQQRARRVRIAASATAAALLLGALLLVAYVGMARSFRGVAVLTVPPTARGQYTFPIEAGLDLLIAALPPDAAPADRLLRERHAQLKGLFHGTAQMIVWPGGPLGPERWALHVPFAWSGEALAPNLEELLGSSGVLRPRGPSTAPPGSQPILGWYEVRRHGLVVTSDRELEVPTPRTLGPVEARDLLRRTSSFRWEGRGLPAPLQARLRRDQRETIGEAPVHVVWKARLGPEPEAVVTFPEAPGAEAIRIRPLWPVIGAPAETAEP